MKTLNRLAIFLSALLLWLHPSDGLTFLTPTHRLINEKASQGASIVIDEFGNRISFDDFLRDVLRFPDGLRTLVSGKSVLEWIGEGGVAEDEAFGNEYLGGALRSVQHFHTPLKSWDQSGLRLSDGTGYESSVRWAQNPSQGITGKASWKDARDAYYAALTSSNQDDRDRKFADTFRILGQLMHLVADLGSVAHTRNDSHIEGDGLESFMGDPINQSLIAGFEGIDPSTLQEPSGDPIATVPVARIWDTDTYNGTNPGITTGSDIGLAEFTSANFFSDDTISRTTSDDPTIPFPAIDRLSPGPVDFYPPTGKPRQYLRKEGDGVAPISHMVAEGIFVRFNPPFFSRYVLDDLVYADYAQELLPRAIGYSAGLIDYFFRGRLGTFVHDVGCFFPRQKPPTFDVYAYNLSPEGEETQIGEMDFVIHYTVGGQSRYISLPHATVNLDREQRPVYNLNGSILDEIPADATDIFMIAAYRGPLGLENDAVIGSIGDLLGEC